MGYRVKPAPFDPSQHVYLDEATKISGYSRKQLSEVIVPFKRMFKARNGLKNFFLRSDMEKLAAMPKGKRRKRRRSSTLAQNLTVGEQKQNSHSIVDISIDALKELLKSGIPVSLRIK